MIVKKYVCYCTNDIFQNCFLMLYTDDITGIEIKIYCPAFRDGTLDLRIKLELSSKIENAWASHSRRLCEGIVKPPCYSSCKYV